MKIKKLIAIFLPVIISTSSYNSTAMDHKDQEVSVNLPVKDQQHGNICVICLDKLMNENDNTALPCSHVYHTSCINKWLKENNTCPLCKLNSSAQSNVHHDDIAGNNRTARCQEQFAQCLKVGCFIITLSCLAILFGNAI